MSAASLTRLIAGRAQEVATALWLYRQLVRQRRAYARAGRDRRRPSELVEEAGAVLMIKDHELEEVRVATGRVAASQKADEILGFLDRVEALGPRRVCEIGTSAAGTLYLLSRVAAADAVLVSVDLETPPHLAAARRRLGRPGQRVVSIAGDSHSPATLERVRGELGGEALDVLFLDGDHSYEGVRRDFELYAPLVRPGGIVGLHDIQEDFATRHGAPTPSISGDVPGYWVELRAGRRTEELIADPEQDGYGIGVVYI